MKTIGFFFLFILLLYGFCYALPIKLRLQRKLGATFSGEKVREIAAANDLDANKIIRAEKIILTLGLFATVFITLSNFI